MQRILEVINEIKIGLGDDNAMVQFQSEPGKMPVVGVTIIADLGDGAFKFKTNMSEAMITDAALDTVQYIVRDFKGSHDRCEKRATG